MRLGLFMMPLHPSYRAIADCYDRDIDQLVLADKLGFDEAWLGEHFTEKWENAPSPDLLIAKALALTKRIRTPPGDLPADQLANAVTEHRPEVVHHRLDDEIVCPSLDLPPEMPASDPDQNRALLVVVIDRFWQSERYRRRPSIGCSHSPAGPVFPVTSIFCL